MKKILIIDDEDSIRQTLDDILTDEGFETVLIANPKKALKEIKTLGKDYIYTILLDIWMPEMNGLDLLEKIKELYPEIPIIMISGHANIETAVKATRNGAYDFIEKPLDLDKVLLTINHAIETYSLSIENQDLKNKFIEYPYEMIGESLKIQEVHQQIQLAAPSDAWVLIHGENGSGKELVARKIHFLSQRHHQPFVEMNCAAIPEELIESELFGHEKGAFTGAINKKEGKFDKANHGTLFLDEIGDMSLKTQAKVLRILQEQKFEPVGSNETIQVNVRIIAASNKNLMEEIKKGNFREDLYYRLNVIPITVPPLRERIKDISVLANYFLNQFCLNYNLKPKKISPAAMSLMENYSWPGNVRELKNIIERLVIMTKENRIEPQHLSFTSDHTNQSAIQVNNHLTLKEARDEFEKMFILQTLEKNHWNITKTSESIQLERSNLHKKIKQFGIIIPTKIRD